MKEWLFILVFGNSIQTLGPMDAGSCMGMLLEEPQPFAICVNEKFPNLRIVKKDFPDNPRRKPGLNQTTERGDEKWVR